MHRSPNNTVSRRSRQANKGSCATWTWMSMQHGHFNGSWPHTHLMNMTTAARACSNAPLTPGSLQSAPASPLDDCDVGAVHPHLRRQLRVVPEAEHVLSWRVVARHHHSVEHVELELLRQVEPLLLGAHGALQHRLAKGVVHRVVPFHRPVDRPRDARARACTARLDAAVSNRHVQMRRNFAGRQPLGSDPPLLTVAVQAWQRRLKHRLRAVWRRAHGRAVGGCARRDRILGPNGSCGEGACGGANGRDGGAVGSVGTTLYPRLVGSVAERAPLEAIFRQLPLLRAQPPRVPSAPIDELHVVGSSAGRLGGAPTGGAVRASSRVRACLSIMSSAESATLRAQR
eukprot:1324160-Prymnesium_polylepis.1